MAQCLCLQASTAGNMGFRFLIWKLRSQMLRGMAKWNRETWTHCWKSGKWSDSQLFLTLCYLMDYPVLEFSRSEYWNGISSRSPEELPNPGIEPRSPAFLADSLPTELWWFAILSYCNSRVIFIPLTPLIVLVQALSRQCTRYQLW